MNYSLSNDFITMKDSNVDQLKCIHYFDQGYERIYIVDQKNYFFGMVLERQNFYNIFQDNLNWISYLQEDQMLIVPENEDLDEGKILAYYQHFNAFIPIYVLSEENIDEIRTSDGTSLFIYIENFYQKFGIKKIQLNELFLILFQKMSQHILDLIDIKTDWVSLRPEKCDVINCIKQFDLGYESIYLLDENDKFKSVVFEHLFKEDFFDSNFRKLENCCIQYNASEDAFKQNIVYGFIGNHRHEMAVVDAQNKILASAKKKKAPLGANFSLDWSIIDLKLMKDHLGNKKILLSSTSLELGKFYQRFNEVLQIELLDETTLTKYYNRYYDIVISNSNVWDNIFAEYLNIRLLYLDFFSFIVTKKIKEKGVNYYYFHAPTSNKTNQQVRFKLNHKFFDATKNEYIMSHDYYTYKDCEFKNLIKIENHCRRTYDADSLRKYKNKIYCYGPCIAISPYVADKDTWVNVIQKRLNQENMDYMIQYGGGMFGQDYDTDINSLKIIFNQLSNYKKSDIVIQLGFKQYDSGIFQEENYQDMLAFHNDFANTRKKIYIDWLNHLNEEGEELLAEYIYQIIIDCFKKD